MSKNFSAGDIVRILRNAVEARKPDDYKSFLQSGDTVVVDRVDAKPDTYGDIIWYKTTMGDQFIPFVDVELASNVQTSVLSSSENTGDCTCVSLLNGHMPGCPYCK